jgi:predicted amidophosphoribosyltransferase
MEMGRIEYLTATYPGCGATAAISARFYSACGNPMGSAKCGSCGQLLQNDTNFCPKCGTPSGNLRSGQNADSMEHIIAAIRLLVLRAHPQHYRYLQTVFAAAATATASRISLHYVHELLCTAGRF